MDVLREREVKDSLERQLIDEQKLRGKRSQPFAFCFACTHTQLQLHACVLNHYAARRRVRHVGRRREKPIIMVRF